MINLEITSYIAAFLAIIMFVLTMMVSMQRVNLGKQAGDIAKFVFGDGDDEIMRRRIRAFGNFIEYVPTCLIMIALIEMQGASDTLVWCVGGAFVVGRLLHATGMLTNPRKPLLRIVGMFATYAALLVPAGWLLLAHS